MRPIDRDRKFERERSILFDYEDEDETRRMAGMRMMRSSSKHTDGSRREAPT